MGDMSGMDGMSSMDSGSAMMFKPTNMLIARVYWYLIIALIALLAARRVLNLSTSIFLYEKSNLAIDDTTDVTIALGDFVFILVPFLRGRATCLHNHWPQSRRCSESFPIRNRGTSTVEYQSISALHRLVAAFY